MDFATAVSYLRDGQAVRTPRMNGWVKRVDLLVPSGVDSPYSEAYDLVFVEHNDVTRNDGTAQDSGDSKTTYAFRCYAVGTGSARTAKWYLPDVSAPGEWAYEPGTQALTPVLALRAPDLALDMQLFSELVKTDWSVFSAADLEAAAAASATSRW